MNQHYIDGLILFFDPENMGADSIFIKIFAFLSKIYKKLDFSPMAEQICIKNGALLVSSTS